jgi:hypothetical protein
MRIVRLAISCSAAVLSSATPALAASDYFLVIDGVNGGATTAMEVQSWSWGTSNSAAARDSGPRVTASQNTQSLRAAPIKAPPRGGGDCDDGDCNVTPAQVGDLDGDGRPNLAQLATVEEVSGFTLTFAPRAAARQICAAGKHIAKAHLVGREGVIDLENVRVGSCSGGGGAGGMTMAITGQARTTKGGENLAKVTLLK